VQLQGSAQQRRSSTGGGGSSGGEAGADGGSSHQPKPFLQRRSQQVVGRKLDWSGVQSKTHSRLDSRYVPVSKARFRAAGAAASGASAAGSGGDSAGLQRHQHHQQQASSSSSSYDRALAAARARAGLMDSGAGGLRRSRCASPCAGYAAAGYDVEIHSSTFYRRQQSGGAAGRAAARHGARERGGSMRTATAATAAGADGGAPAAHGVHRSVSASSHGSGSPESPERYMFVGGGHAGAASSWQRLSASAGTLRGSAGVAAAGGMDGRLQLQAVCQKPLPPRASAAAEAPLDDLLQHVNQLIHEFDRLYDH
jgi:hypothetical protein